MLTSSELRAVICNSVMVRDEMRRYYNVPESQLVVIENGVDLESFHPKLSDAWREKQRKALGIAADSPVFLFVGSGFERKGIPQLLSAMAGMKQPAHLVVVGQDRQLATYQRQAKKLGLGTRVQFVGPQHDVRPYYGMADAFVLPTRYDPMPNAALEAMACGLPIITSSTCGIAPRVTSGENGYVCDALDVEQLSAHLDQLASQGKAQAMRASARSAVLDLDLETMAAKLLHLYHSLLQTPGLNQTTIGSTL